VRAAAATYGDTMKLSTTQRLVFAAFAFVLLSAGDCGGLSFSDIVTGHSALITAKNNASENIELVLYADDASNVGPVIPHGENTITTHIDGTYTVVVLPAGGGAPSSLTSRLNALRVATQDLYKAQGQDQDLHVHLANQRIEEARSELQLVRHPELALASCTGVIKFAADFAASPKPIELRASVTKADGVWAAACPSN
jgi:hypothetical protein